jgi:hypothetical protein
MRIWVRLETNADPKQCQKELNNYEKRVYNACDADLLFYDRKDGNKKKLEEKHFDIECYGFNGYGSGRALKPMRIQNSV